MVAASGDLSSSGIHALIGADPGHLKMSATAAPNDFVHIEQYSADVEGSENRRLTGGS